MKLVRIIFLLVVILSVNSANNDFSTIKSRLLKAVIYKEYEGKSNDCVRTVINEFLYTVLNRLYDYLNNKGQYPVKLPNVTKSFTKFFKKGTFNLTEGRLSGIENIYIDGNATFEIAEKNEMSLIVPLKLNNLDVLYTYDLDYAGRKHGQIKATLVGMKLRMHIAFNTEDLRFFLNEFKIFDHGTLNVHFEGNFLDKTLNVFIKMLKPFFKTSIESKIENGGRDVLNYAIDFLNSGINQLFNPY